MSDERKELLYIFDELVTNATRFNNPLWQKQRDEAYKKIRQIIQQQPEIDEAFIIKKWTDKFFAQYRISIGVEDLITQIISDARGGKR